LPIFSPTVMTIRFQPITVPRPSTEHIVKEDDLAPAP
jgi:hypothetical protein